MGTDGQEIPASLRDEMRMRQRRRKCKGTPYVCYNGPANARHPREEEEEEEEVERYGRD